MQTRMRPGECLLRCFRWPYRFTRILLVVAAIPMAALSPSSHAESDAPTAYDPENCQQPVYLLVTGDIYDRKKFADYVRALAESGLYPAYKAYYRAITPADKVLEGEPPATRGTLLAKFPCQQAVEHFWASREYNEIRKLREGIADFDVTIMKALPVPDYVDW